MRIGKIKRNKHTERIAKKTTGGRKANAVRIKKGLGRNGPRRG